MRLLPFALRLISVLIMLICTQSKVFAANSASYADELNAIYKNLPTLRNNCSKNESVFPADHKVGLSIIDLSNADELKTKTNELNKELAIIEKSAGNKSIKAVPILMQLSECSKLDPPASDRFRQAALQIGEQYFNSGKCSCRDAAYLATLFGLRRSGPITATSFVHFRKIGVPGSNYSPLSVDSCFRLEYKYQLIASGLAALPSLSTLCNVLESEGKGDEAIVLLKAALAQCQKSADPQLQMLARQMLPMYMLILNKKGKTAEALSVRHEIDAESKQGQNLMLVRSKDYLEKAKRRAEVDPYGLEQAELSLADTEIMLKETDEGRRIIEEALILHSHIAPEDDSSRLNEQLWKTLVMLIGQSDSIENEVLIYKAVDVCEAQAASSTRENRFSLSEMYEIARQFKDKEKKSKAIKFLEYVMERTKQLCPKDVESMIETSRELRSLYDEDGDYDKSERVASSALKAAETQAKDGKLLIGAMLDLADVYEHEHKYNESQDYSKKTLEFFLRSEKIDGSLGNRLATKLIASKKLPEADEVIRHMYMLAEGKRHGGSGLSYLGGNVDGLIKAYEEQSKFSEAESLLDVTSRGDAIEGYPTKWCYIASGLYLQHAAALKKQGQDASAAVLLAKSNLAFETFISEFDARTDDSRSYGPKHRAEREEALKKYGFASN